MINFAKPSISEKEIKKVVEVMESGWITTGKVTKEFGEKLAGKIGAKYCLPMSSCTAALHIALICAGVKKGDEVITSPMTFVSTINVIKYLGAVPVLVDIKPNDYIIDEDKIVGAITKRTRAIIPVHFGGYSANMNKIRKIANKYNLEIIEDAAHAYGSKYGNEYIGQNSRFACFSFYPTKNITSIEGGAFVTNNKKIYERACSLALHGISREAWKRYTKEGSWRYDVLEIGYKYNMTDVQAAVGLIQLTRLDELQKKRDLIHKHYTDNLSNIRGLEILSGNAYSNPFRHLFVVKISPVVINKDKFIADMKAMDIICSVHFIPIYHFSAYKKEFSYLEGKLGVTEQAHSSCVSLPFSADITLNEAKKVVAAVKEILAVARDKFLSNAIGKPAFNVNLLEPQNYQNKSFYSFVTTDRKGILEKCKKQGFARIGGLVELIKEHKSGVKLKITNHPEYDVASQEDRQITKNEIPALQEIGRELVLVSRFYKDPSIKDKTYNIYNQWITNSFLHGYVDDYVLARENKRIIGFATIRDRSELILDLIGVHKDYQGRGVGQLMLQIIEKKYPGRKLKAGTETENVQAINFYTKNGFRIIDYKLVFHKHT